MSPVEPSKRSSNVRYQVTNSSEEPIALPPNPNGNAEHGSDHGSLDTVRDILFGAQSREFEKRCDLLEQRMWNDSSALRKDLTHSLEKLQDQFQKEVLQLSQQLQEERSQRTDSLGDLQQILQDMEVTIAKGLTRVDEETTRKIEVLQGLLIQQREELTAQSQQALANLEDEFQSAILELKSEKTDRGALAEMLMEIGLRLKEGSMESKTT